MFGNVRLTFETILEKNFGKSSENFGKGSDIFGKSSKTSLLVCLCNWEQNITCPLVDMNFIFSCSTRHLTRSLRSLVRYRELNSKIKFISRRGHVISSISFTQGKRTVFQIWTEADHDQLLIRIIVSLLHYTLRHSFVHKFVFEAFKFFQAFSSLFKPLTRNESFVIFSSPSRPP